MNADEARNVDAVMRQLGLPGVVAPEDPEKPTGPWRVYDRADPATRQDITAKTLAALARRWDPIPPQGPTRGFVIP
ncbi:hypothetical protein C6N75_10065 [Streptomyces solincola]|uniref:Uncharacterized protein n=1 Tax=Streptomyces solincola TaxID=2100817 RepID=A0A2S9PYA3_9ACTN|nr:hypothetical protein C6N75_10065 [Streptomyces solincola]